MKNTFRVAPMISIDGRLAGCFEYFTTSEWRKAVDLADEYNTMVEGRLVGSTRYDVLYDARTRK